MRDPAPLDQLSRPPAPTTVLVLFALLCLIWGSTWYGIKLGLPYLPPLSGAAARFTIAALTMIAIAPMLQRREGGVRPPLWLSSALGVLNFAVSYAVVYQSENVLDSGLTSVLWAVYPLLMATAGHWFLGERLRPLQALGFLLGFGGVVVLVTLGADAETAQAPTGTGHLSKPVAALLLLSSPLVTAVGTTLVKRYGQGCSSVLLNRDGMTVGACLLLLAAWWFERDQPMRWTGEAVGSVLGLAWIGTCLSFGLWFWLLRYAPANRLSLISFVTPCIALLLGAVFGGEVITPYVVVGSGLVMAGVVLATRRKKS